MRDAAPVSDTDQCFGERLKQARTSAGLTQEAVADLLGDGFSSVSLYRWEHEKESPSIAKVAQLADLYGVAIDWLTGRTPFQAVFTPGKVVIDPSVLRRVREIVDREGRLEDLPTDVIRHAGIDYAWRLPTDATLLEGAAAQRIETQMQQLLSTLRRRR